MEAVDPFDVREVGIAEARIENPEHDSLVLRFNQLASLLDDEQEDYDYRVALQEARYLVGLIRAQVLK